VLCAKLRIKDIFILFYFFVILYQNTDMKNTSALGLFLLLLFSLSCKKNPSDMDTDLRFDLRYEVDGQPLAFDTLRYTNAAGNGYSVNRLEYYLSSIMLVNQVGDTVRGGKVFYLNARDSMNTSISLPDIPYGNYTHLIAYIGLKPEINLSHTLPATTENINMDWPESMGGGYHFMKLEGYTTATGSAQGYAMHLGNNRSLVRCVIAQAFSVQGTQPVFNLVMNINEWYKNPAVYNFLTDGNYSMNDTTLMKKIAANGTDVFTIQSK